MEYATYTRTCTKCHHVRGGTYKQNPGYSKMSNSAFYLIILKLSLYSCYCCCYNTNTTTIHPPSNVCAHVYHERTFLTNAHIEAISSGGMVMKPLETSIISKPRSRHSSTYRRIASGPWRITCSIHPPVLTYLMMHHDDDE